LTLCRTTVVGIGGPGVTIFSCLDKAISTERKLKNEAVGIAIMRGIEACSCLKDILGRLRITGQIDTAGTI
jgi:hypothetical protein